MFSDIINRKKNIYEKIYQLKNSSQQPNFAIDPNNKEFLVSFFGLLTEFVSMIPTKPNEATKDQFKDITEQINNLNDIKTNISSYIDAPIKDPITTLIDSLVNSLKIDDIKINNMDQVGGYRIFRRIPTSKKIYQ